MVLTGTSGYRQPRTIAPLLQPRLATNKLFSTKGRDVRLSKVEVRTRCNDPANSWHTPLQAAALRCAGDRLIALSRNDLWDLTQEESYHMVLEFAFTRTRRCHVHADNTKIHSRYNKMNTPPPGLPDLNHDMICRQQNAPMRVFRLYEVSKATRTTTKYATGIIWDRSSDRIRLRIAEFQLETQITASKRSSHIIKHIIHVKKALFANEPFRPDNGADRKTTAIECFMGDHDPIVRTGPTDGMLAGYFAFALTVNGHWLGLIGVVLGPSIICPYNTFLQLEPGITLRLQVDISRQCDRSSTWCIQFMDVVDLIDMYRIVRRGP